MCTDTMERILYLFILTGILTGIILFLIHTAREIRVLNKRRHLLNQAIDKIQAEFTEALRREAAERERAKIIKLNKKDGE